MMLGARTFIVAVYSLIGLAFVSVTATLAWEFQNAAWFSIATFYSHLFIFFPIFGVVALFAFYWPSVVFVHMYWNHIPGGRWRFSIGLVALALLSYGVAQLLVAGEQRSLFEIPPAALLSDVGEPANCDGSAAPCARLPLLAGLKNVRRMSQRRVGLNDLVRNCAPDPLIEVLDDKLARRYCFVTTAALSTPILTSDRDCCRAQRSFMSMSEIRANPARSMTSYVHQVTLPLMVFFLLTLLVIGIMLALRRRRLEQYYREHMGAIEKGVLIGAVAMLFFPVMNHAFLQSAAMLDVAGGANSYRSPAPFFSFIFGGWALTLLFFFYRRRDKEVEFLGRIGGVIASAIAIAKYDAIISYFVRYAGSGASPRDVGVLVAVGIALLVALRIKSDTEFVGAKMFGSVAAAKLAADAVAASSLAAAGAHSDFDTSPLPAFNDESSK